jgi:inosose dehydratase
VCEVPGWGHQLDPDRVLAEMASLGITATELGPDGFLPTDAAELRSLLARHGLSLVAGFLPAVLHDAGRWPAERDDVARRVAVLAGNGAEMVVLAAATGADDYERSVALGDDGWSQLAVAVTEIESMAADLGMQLCLHPHYGTIVESPGDIDRLAAASPVDLCLDTGHVMVGGGDPLDIARRYADRITHVHMKDVDAALAARVRDGDLTYHAAVVVGMYRPLGEGDVDVAGILAALDDAGFDGWLVLEQDKVLDAAPTPGRGPVDEAGASYRYLQAVPAA